MILQCRREHLVLVSEAVEGVISAFVTEKEITLEAGGILIGSYRRPHIEISYCTGPLPADVRKPLLFDRRDPGHQATALRFWRASDKTATFVGEWHTHPQDHPTPSRMDLQTWGSVLMRTQEPLVFLIAGRLSLWCGLGHERTIHPASALT